MKLEQIVRVERNRVSLPMVTLTRQKRQVVLIGMLHIASPRFFKFVMSRLCSYEQSGFRILYEAIDPHLKLESGLIEKKYLQKRLEYKRDVLFRRLKTFGLAYQSDHVQPKPTWDSADFTSDDWKRKNIDVIPKNRAEVNRLDRRIDHPEIFVRLFIKGLRNMSPEQLDKMKFGEVIVGQRNEVAVSAMLDHAKYGNVATYWGTGHLPGMINLLSEAGFAVEKIEWTPAINYRFQ